MSHTYTRISIWRNGDLTQMVEIDLSTRTPHACKRMLRVWFARIVSLETDHRFTIRVQSGSAFNVDLECNCDQSGPVQCDLHGPRE